MSVGRLTAADQQEVLALLAANGLPPLDPGAETLLLGEFDGQGLAGAVGLEARGRSGLLRSLAVRGDRRGAGLGGALVSAVESAAAEQGVTDLYLLTTTAERFFAGRGYAPVSREAAPAEIRATSEFAEVCPASSAFMHKCLT